MLLTPPGDTSLSVFDDLLTARARHALTLAREDAQRLGHDRARPEHLLLGLLRERHNVAANILAAFGVEAKAVISAIDELPVPEDGATLDDAIEWAAGEAHRLGHKSIGTEHLLLGLLREGGRVVAIFERLKVDLPSLRSYVLDIMAGRSTR